MVTIKLKKASTETEQMSTSAAVIGSSAENVKVEKRQWADPAVLKEFSERANETLRDHRG